MNTATIPIINQLTRNSNLYYPEFENNEIERQAEEVLMMKDIKNLKSDKDFLLSCVTTALDVTKEEITIKRSRKRSLVIPRQIYFTLLRMFTNMSYDKIGLECSRDHATTLYRVKSVVKMLEIKDVLMCEAWRKVIYQLQLKGIKYDEILNKFAVIRERSYGYLSV